MMMPADVLVTGAGPGGCAAALSFAREGAQVVLVGLRGSPDRGLSGEWLHPAGVAILRELGVRLDGADFTENHGFMVHPGGGRAPLLLPYAQGKAVSMPHHVLVDRLRRAAVEHGSVTLLLDERVTEATTAGSAATTAGNFQADLLIGADGRASLLRRALRPRESPAMTLSTTAGFDLVGASLPIEKYGHIFLGGPGPALAYRIAPDTIRLSLDVVSCRLTPSQMGDYLRNCYAPALPGELRDAFIEATAHGLRPRWAANRFRQRLFYGDGRLALVGDAVGFGHPLAAHGMTTAILDGDCVGRRGDVVSYERERRTRSWAAERLGMALHRALTDTESALFREALFQIWGHDPAESERMMRLLAVQEDRRREFSLVVAHIATIALLRPVETGEEGPLISPLARWVRAVPQLVNWLRWLYGSHAIRPKSMPSLISKHG